MKPKCSVCRERPVVAYHMVLCEVCEYARLMGEGRASEQAKAAREAKQRAKPEKKQAW